MYKLRTLSIKTQVRRLKYFSIFIDFLRESGLQKKILERRMLDWSREKNSDFKKYISQSGEIVLKKPKIKSHSFLNYLEAAVKLKLVYEETEYIKTTRIGKVLEAIRRICEPDKNIDNPHELGTSERLLFLYVILSYDADLFITIMYMLYESPAETLDFYLKSFQKNFLSRLKDKIKHVSPSESTKVNDALNRVNRWRNAIRYSEDIVPSRLNWLLDLGLLSEELYGKERKYQLNNLGKVLYESFPYISTQLKDINDVWVNENFSNFLSLYYGDKKVKDWSQLGDDEKEKVMIEALFYARKHFSPLALPRLAVVQTFLFTSLFLLSQKQVKIEFDDIAEWIGFERIVNGRRIGLRMAARPEESYLLISNA
jgi:hypothetical protein